MKFKLLRLMVKNERINEQYLKTNRHYENYEIIKKKIFLSLNRI